MPKQVVFPCPSCGASLSVDESAAAVQCQFCGSTAMVPAALRGPAPQPSAPYTPPVSSAPYYVPMMTPVMPDTNRIWRSVFGLNIAITAAVVIMTVCITAAAILPFGLMAFPGIWTGLAHLLSH